MRRCTGLVVRGLRRIVGLLVLGLPVRTPGGRLSAVTVIDFRGLRARGLTSRGLLLRTLPLGLPVRPPGRGLSARGLNARGLRARGLIARGLRALGSDVTGRAVTRFGLAGSVGRGLTMMLIVLEDFLCFCGWGSAGS